MLTENRLFDEQQAIWFQFLRKDLRHRTVHTPMKIDGNAKVRPECLTHGTDSRQHGVELAVTVQILKFRGAVNLNRREATTGDFPGGGNGLARAITADPGIDPDAVPHLPAEQLMDRLVECLALDVPECLVDACDSAHVHGAAAIEPSTIHDRPMILDEERVLSEE